MELLIYALTFCQASGIDPAAAVRFKLKRNAEKYPVELAKGNADKYDQLRR